MPEIGVVIPAYNVARFLPATLDSVRAQSWRDWTCIVVDDGSTDETRAVADRYAAMDDRILAHSVSNGGQARARNVGARSLHPTVRYVVFLDADDVWEPGALATLHSALEDHPNAAAVAGLPRDMDVDGNLMRSNYADAARYDVERKRRGVTGWRLVPWETTQPSGLATLAVWCHIETPGLVLIRRAAFDRTLGFRGSTSPSEDWDLWLQLARLGPIIHLSAFVLRKRVVPGSESRQGRKMRRAEPSMRRLWVGQQDLSPVERRTLVVGHFYACLQRFLWARNELLHGNVARASTYTRHGIFALGRFALIQGLEPLASRRIHSHGDTG